MNCNAKSGLPTYFAPPLLAVLSLTLFLGACATSSSGDRGSVVTVTAPQHTSIAKRKFYSPGSFDTSPEPQQFSICFGAVCEHTASIGLSASDWDRIRAVFQTSEPLTAEMERERMGEAVGLLESMVIPDAKNAATIGYWPLHMDCIDEATNVTVYLTMMLNDGLLRWHRIGSPATRGFFTLLLSLPHTTAVIQEVESNTEYAVDSYYRSNGQPPYIVPLSEWRQGWNPNKVEHSNAGLN